MRCLIWAAVSSKPQASDEKDSIPSQIQAARELIQKTAEWHEAHEPLVIPGHTRSYIFLADAAQDIAEYAQLMNLAREDEIDLLICRGRDRLGRTDALVSQVEAYLREYGCQILSLSMPSQIQDPTKFRKYKDQTSIWLTAIEKGRAESEVAELQYRFQQGMKSRIRKRGLHANRIPYGYRLNEETDIGEPYPPEAEVVQLIFRWFLEGKSYKDIRELLPIHATERYPRHDFHLRYILENPYYRGYVSFGRYDYHRKRKPGDYTIAKGKHEAIITEQVWDAAQRELAARLEQGKRGAQSRYPLSGFVICGYCGRRMRVSPGGTGEKVDRIKYYVCPYNDCDRPTKRNSVRVEDLEANALRLILEWHSSPSSFKVALEQTITESDAIIGRDLDRLARAIDKKVAALERWRDDYLDGLISRDEYYPVKHRLEEELAAIQAELEQEQRRLERIDPQPAYNRLDELIATWSQDFEAAWYDRSNVKEVKAWLRQIGFRIVITSPKADTKLNA